ncbi:MAG TPA: PQQ-dependent sugar dehydrogenase [Trinickia sp.]|jgi:glucose/arabinose dehydrogenase|uniref:PQQ-dependent sugar dehydrogenase n=1 Tax=Trinickia sp. TaxID=2571163 RepID=UPI002C959266|nr:PQQ-dependent sugar dehydrogenase [Trinickia sp.]HTI17315.1 PQQ-dependent sugar dehydrogenase [Trinickia sp.]
MRSPGLLIHVLIPACLIASCVMRTAVAANPDPESNAGKDKVAQASTPMRPTPPAAGSENPDRGDWHSDAPGVVHRIDLSNLPAPYSTRSAGNGPRVVSPPEKNAAPAAPPGFTARRFAAGLTNPRLIRVAPNGDIFIAESGADRIRVLRAADGADAPTENRVFADKLDYPFGIAFYPPGHDPQWIYVANENSVVRFAYRSGDLQARGAAQTVIARLSQTTGGHTTRDIAFSQDGKRMFIAIGSASNIADGMARKNRAEISAWEAEHGLGAAWGTETHRAIVLATDPEGRSPLQTFATGMRNPVAIAVNPSTGELWTVVNERDGLGDDLVPDYVTRVSEHAFYGWPWYYLGRAEDPKYVGERPDLAGHVTVPDMLLRSHSAPLGLCFYTATEGVSAFPDDYRGDAFVALHGSWNRSHRTGYKVVRVRVKNGAPTGEYVDFLTGFMIDDNKVWGRPVSVAVARDGALLVTEDGNDTVWRVSYSKR